MKKTEKLLRIKAEVISTFKWECPCCCEKYEADEGDELETFVKSLYEQGVRWKSMKYMQGVFCKTCYEDPEIQNSTL